MEESTTELWGAIVRLDPMLCHIHDVDSRVDVSIEESVVVEGSVLIAWYLTTSRTLQSPPKLSSAFHIPMRQLLVAMTAQL